LTGVLQKGSFVTRSHSISGGRLLTWLLFLASASTAAFAQIRHLPARIEGDDVRMLATHARCIVDHVPARVRALLAMDTASADAARDGLSLVQDVPACQFSSDSSMTYSVMLWDGDLAEVMVVQGLAAGGLAARVAADSSRPPVQARNETELMGLCVVRADPAGAETLFRTVPMTPPETNALNAILPHVSPCLRRGVQMNLNRMMLRATLALAAYRLSDQNGTPATAGAP
jgi:hypothetical protein